MGHASLTVCLSHTSSILCRNVSLEGMACFPLLGSGGFLNCSIHLDFSLIALNPRKKTGLCRIFWQNIERIKLIYQHLRVQVHLSTYFSRKKNKTKNLTVTEATLHREAITHHEESLGDPCHLIPSSQVEMILKP